MDNHMSTLEREDESLQAMMEQLCSMKDMESLKLKQSIDEMKHTQLMTMMKGKGTNGSYHDISV